ncbi:MAG: DUF4388 domain-containing protein [Acidobacteriota bacterium]
MALEGTLQDFSLADIFQLIGLQRKTGTLTLTGTEDTVSVTFDSGRIVGADSENKHIEDRLGHVLLKTRKLEPRELTRMLRIQKETGRRLGSILLKERAITRTELIRALQIQVSTILFRLFRWSDGQYHFSQSTQVEYDHQCFEPIPVEDILMEGLRILDEWPLIEKRVRSFSLVYGPADPGRHVESEPTGARDLDDDESELAIGFADEVLDAPGPSSPPSVPPDADGHETVTVSAEELVVYRLLDRRQTVQDIIDRSDLGEFETCKALFHLLEKDLIIEVESTRDGTAAHNGPTASFDRALAIGLAVLTAAILSGSFWMQRDNTPEQFAAHALWPVNLNAELSAQRLAASRIRLARLEYAVRLYALHKGRYPEQLDDLVRVGLADDADIRDPWGTPYGYVLSRRNFQLRGVDGKGAAHPDLILTGSLGLPDVRDRTGDPLPR